ncbi:unnamed protein product [Paramecium sonneborni]|uniref:Uncharacterized protein n=1 Tax=Paramecium sonneborni TaxID=65129 RepID=A0A8S1RS71_9CILI|nr:unnamed protein product [Paramecium sonneborni]
MNAIKYLVNQSMQSYFYMSQIRCYFNEFNDYVIIGCLSQVNKASDYLNFGENGFEQLKKIKFLYFQIELSISNMAFMRI